MSRMSNRKKRKLPTNKMSTASDNNVDLHSKLILLERQFLHMFMLSAPWWSRHVPVTFDMYMKLQRNSQQGQISLDDLRCFIEITDQAFVFLRPLEKKKLASDRAKGHFSEDVYATAVEHLTTPLQEDYDLNKQLEIVFVNLVKGKLTPKGIERKMQAVRQSLLLYQYSHDMSQTLPMCDMPSINIPYYISSSLSSTITMEKNDATIADILSQVRSATWFNGELIENKVTPARPADLISFEACINAPDVTSHVFQMYFPIARALIDAGKEKLYLHQIEAIQHIRQGKHIIIATSTASGKSLTYIIPVLERLLLFKKKSSASEIREKFLFIFPTKALAQDQLRALNEYIHSTRDNESLPVIANAVDGDTPFRERQQRVLHSDIILTNPDFLHSTLLSKHEEYKALFSALSLVVLDETHVYSGVFGSHVSLVLRRLRRVCSLYERKIQFVGASATINNAHAFFQCLIGLPVVLVDRDSSQQNKKTLAIWAPDVNIEEKTDKIQGSHCHTMAAKILIHLLKLGINCICFCKTRHVSEQITYKAQTLKNGKHRQEIMCYRGGYSAFERRDIEKQFFTGRLKAMVCTNAMELGVDVGSLRVTLHVGFPTSVANFMQQAGRAGRGVEESLSLILAYDAPLDHYYISNPTTFFQENVGKNFIFPLNPRILKGHVLCACFEKDIDVQKDSEVFDMVDLPPIVNQLVGDGLMKKIEEHVQLIPFAWVNEMNKHEELSCFIMPRSMSKTNETVLHHGMEISDDESPDIYSLNPGSPANLIDIRNTKKEEQQKKFSVFDQDKLAHVDNVAEEGQILRFFYPGALYFKQGEVYTVQSLDFSTRTAFIKKVPSSSLPLSYYTSPERHANIDIAQRMDSVELNKTSELSASHGRIRLRKSVTGYRTFSISTRQELDYVSLDLPIFQFETNAMWLQFSLCPEDLQMTSLDVYSGIHVLCHGLIELIRLFVPYLGTGMELRANCPEVSGNENPNQRTQYRIVVYELHKEGLGLAHICFQKIRELLESCINTLKACKCIFGCPKCCHSSYCLHYNHLMNKKIALIILDEILFK